MLRIDRDWIHPIRWRRTRLFAGEFGRKYRNQGGTGGRPGASLFQSMGDLVVTHYNSAIERVPREFRPERAMPIVSEELSLAMHHMAFSSNGANVFFLVPTLVELLELTDLGDMRLEDVRIPFDSFYLSFGSSFRGSLPGPRNQIDGAYVSCPDDGKLEVVVTSRRLDARPDRSAGWPYTRDVYFYAVLESKPGETIEQILEGFVQAEMKELELRSVVPHDDAVELPEDITSVYPELKMTSIQHVTAREKMAYIEEGLTAFKAALALAMVAICYLNSAEENEEIGAYPDGAPEDLVEKARSTNHKKRRNAQKQLEIDGWQKIRLLGTKQCVPQAVEGITSSTTRAAVAPHVRRGHMRRQAYGPERSLRRAVWIRPMFINAEQFQASDGDRGRIYVVDAPG